MTEATSFHAVSEQQLGRILHIARIVEKGVLNASMLISTNPAQASLDLQDVTSNISYLGRLLNEIRGPAEEQTPVYDKDGFKALPPLPPATPSELKADVEEEPEESKESYKETEKLFNRWIGAELIIEGYFKIDYSAITEWDMMTYPGVPVKVLEDTKGEPVGFATVVEVSDMNLDSVLVCWSLPDCIPIAAYIISAEAGDLYEKFIEDMENVPDHLFLLNYPSYEHVWDGIAEHIMEEVGIQTGCSLRDPVFLEMRKKAADLLIESDVRSVGNAEYYRLVVEGTLEN